MLVTLCIYVQYVFQKQGAHPCDKVKTQRLAVDFVVFCVSYIVVDVVVVIALIPLPSHLRFACATRRADACVDIFNSGGVQS